MYRDSEQTYRDSEQTYRDSEQMYRDSKKMYRDTKNETPEFFSRLIILMCMLRRIFFI